jgi:hypothetical protein
VRAGPNGSCCIALFYAKCDFPGFQRPSRQSAGCHMTLLSSQSLHRFRPCGAQRGQD